MNRNDICKHCYLTASASLSRTLKRRMECLIILNDVIDDPANSDGDDNKIKTLRAEFQNGCWSTTTCRTGVGVGVGVTNAKAVTVGVGVGETSGVSARN